MTISMMKMKEEQRQQQQQQQLLQPSWHKTFPFKLYEMLEYSSDSEFSSSLSWSADGSAFIIHDKHVLMNDLAPIFFKQTQFHSFVSVPRATCGVLFTLLLYLSFAKALKKSTNISLTPHSLFQTRQLHIWGFVRTDAFGGEMGGWQHDDLLFLRGRPDLLREICWNIPVRYVSILRIYTYRKYKYARPIILFLPRSNILLRLNRS